jgi:spore maturation protein CgeB
MQISDGGTHLREFFEVGEEIVGYGSPDDLVEKLRYYLAHDEERRRIARNGYRRVLKEYRFQAIMRRSVGMILEGMRPGGSASGWK